MYPKFCAKSGASLEGKCIPMWFYLDRWYIAFLTLHNVCVDYSYVGMWHCTYWSLFCFINLHFIFEMWLHWYGKTNVMVKFVHYNWYILFILSGADRHLIGLQPFSVTNPPAINTLLHISWGARAIIHLGHISGSEITGLQTCTFFKKNFQMLTNYLHNSGIN